MTTLTQTLIQGGVIKRLQMPIHFYQQLFGNTFLSKTDTIIFDEVYEDYRGMAKFVPPNVVATVNGTKGFDVKSFRPAYAKEKDVIEAWSESLQTRTAGEELGGSFTPAQRAQMVRAKQLRMHRIKMENLYEYMAFQAVAGGKIEINMPDYPKSTVDYFRNAQLTASTFGAQNWATPTNNPLDGIAKMVDLVYDASQEEVDTLIMGRTAWANFYRYFTDKDRRHLLDKNVRGSNLEINLLSAGTVQGVNAVASFTALNGQTIDIYVDNRSYLDPINGAAKRYVNDNEIIGLSSMGFKGVMAFGAIKDADAGYQATRMFHKEFRSDEPSADYLLTQSAPLPIVLNPNTTFRVLNVNA